MGQTYLSVELSLDIITAILGLVITLRAHDNYPKLYWGIIAMLIGGMFAWENIGWLIIVDDTPEYRFTDLLDIEKMLKWYALAGIVALYPMASLYPGYLTPFRTLCFQIPVIVIVTAGISYLAFNGTLTPLHTFADIAEGMDMYDVRLRMTIFFFSIVTPLWFFLYPMFRKRVFRRSNARMSLFIGFMMLFLGIYVAFTLSINYFVFNLFGATAIVFTLLFSTMYLTMENPFSTHVAVSGVTTTANADTSGDRNDTEAESEPMTAAVEAAIGTDNVVFCAISSYMNDRHPFADPEYQMENLAADLRMKPRKVSAAIKQAGFSGWREYITELRLEYFHSLAEQHPQRSIKELMYAAGFRSKATFYRNFNARYGITPTAFVESQAAARMVKGSH